MGVNFWIGIGCLATALIGWAAIIIVAVLMPGGHPPLSAYVVVPVILVLFPINLVGFVACLWALLFAEKSSSQKRQHVIVVIGNMTFVAIGIITLT
jgi:hypothetical protein